MKKNIAILTTVAVLSCLAIFTLSPTPAQAGQRQEKHPKIHHAIKALEEAKVELKTAAHDFGGHREAALKECDAAIAELKLALQYDKK